MPSKDSKKPNVEKKEVKAGAPATPVKQKPQAKSDTPRDTPRKKKDDGVTALSFKLLTSESTAEKAAPPVDVQLSGEFNHAEQTKKGDYQKILKLQAANNFTVAKTFMIDDGEYQGYQVIYIKPSKAFKFGELPEEVRNRVYRYYFACKGVVGEAIGFDGKRTATKEAFAKTYADRSKNRVALLATNKEIHKEAVSVFYAQTLRFDTTQTLIDFLSQVVNARPRLRCIEIKTFNKTTARNAMHFLAEAKNIKRLHFEHGVFNEADPKKAAKVFYDCAFRFLKAVGSSKVEGEERDEAAGVDVLSFAKTAFTCKDDKKATRNWEESMVEEFKEEVKKRMR